MDAPLQPKRSGLATASLVLGVLSLLGGNVLTGIPAVICGHIARRGARKLPTPYPGAGRALVGLISGYLGVVLTLVLVPTLVFPAVVKAHERAQRLWCYNHMMQVLKAFKMWGMDHGDRYPFNVSTNQGGTLELCDRGADGFERNPALHFLVLSNELSTPFVLVCPSDSLRRPAADWAHLQASNITYQVHSGADVSDIFPQAVVAYCPIHSIVCRCDGSLERIALPGNGRPLKP